MTHIRKAVFPVAGLGTRFLPATKAVPKEMLPLIDKPLISYAVEEATASGIEELIIVSAHGKEAIADHFDASPALVDKLRSDNKNDLADAVEAARFPADCITFLRQQEPRGLGHAIWCARKLVGDEPFAVMLPDDVVMADKPCLAQMIEAYHTVGGNMAAVMEVPWEHTRRYGILDIQQGDAGSRICRATGLTEKPEPEDASSNLAVIGRYILDPAVFDELDKQKLGSGGEIQITDAMADCIDRVPFNGFRFEGTRFDCGAKDGFLEAIVAFALRHEDLRPTMQRIIAEHAKEARRAA
ncbi:MAG: UTP--glucose-1-phosphate uridylyltransferase GalU [Acetobacterales bacterium]